MAMKFIFNRSLPEPFGKGNKKVKVSSKYGDGTEATLSTTAVKGILAYCKCKDRTTEGAVGCSGTKCVAEYKSAAGPDAYHIAVYDPATGNIMASVYDKNTEMMETYQMHSTAKDGAALFLTMIPELLKDDEFSDTMGKFFAAYQSGFPDMDAARNLLGLLCDNAYRRVTDSKCPAHIKTTLDKAGNTMRVSQANLDSGTFKPNQVLAGEFTIFAQAGAAPVVVAGPAIPHHKFVGQYPLNPTRVLTAHEQMMVPTLDPWYVLPEEVISICKHASMSSGMTMPMRNFLLRGPAGTGKTEGAKAIAAGLNLPYVK